jgi:hypothetical protein
MVSLHGTGRERNSNTTLGNSDRRENVDSKRDCDHSRFTAAPSRRYIHASVAPNQERDASLR